MGGRSLWKQGLSLKLKQNYFQTKTVAKTLFSRFKLLPYTHSSQKWYTLAVLIYLQTGCQVRARNYRLSPWTGNQQAVVKERTINAHLFPFPFLNFCCGLKCYWAPNKSLNTQKSIMNRVWGTMKVLLYKKFKSREWKKHGNIPKINLSKTI